MVSQAREEFPTGTSYHTLWKGYTLTIRATFNFLYLDL